MIIKNTSVSLRVSANLSEKFAARGQCFSVSYRLFTLLNLWVDQLNL